MKSSGASWVSRTILRRASFWRRRRGRWVGNIPPTLPPSAPPRRSASAPALRLGHLELRAQHLLDRRRVPPLAPLVEDQGRTDGDLVACPLDGLDQRELPLLVDVGVDELHPPGLEAVVAED